MTTASREARTRALIEANGFEFDALEANRAGRLVPSQAQRLRQQRRARGAALLVIGALLVVLGAWGLHDAGGVRSDAVLAIIGGIAMIALRWSDFGTSHRRELAAGRVAALDGRIEVRAISGDNHTLHHYRIGGREFQTTEEGAKAVEAQKRYRVYHVADTDLMVNIEPLD